MLGTGLQFGTVRGDDRFYIPVKARKSQSQNQNQQKQVQRKSKNESTDSKSKVTVLNSDDNRNSSPAKESSEPSIAPSSNLERFLESTTPFVPAQYFSKTTMRGWRTCDVEFQHYFPLSDLWESFGEWSAYGAGVPLVLDGCDSVVQYYVPYLSGIQLYGEASAGSNAKSRQVGEDSDGDCYRDSSSDGSSDYELEKGMKFSGEQQHLNNLTKESFRMRSLSIHDEQSVSQEGFSNDDGETQNTQGVLLFEYLERDLPYCREPLADKILDLASRYPGLKTLRSCDILPASWLSVAWYPIYRIPTGPTLKDLDACFLTYHSLSTPMAGGTQAPALVFPREIDGIPKFSLTVVGMASYKLKGSMWMQNGISECHQANSLMQAAENWLRRLQVTHPDFQFFASHSTYSR